MDAAGAQRVPHAHKLAGHAGGFFLGFLQVGLAFGARSVAAGLAHAAAQLVEGFAFRVRPGGGQRALVLLADAQDEDL